MAKIIQMAKMPVVQGKELDEIVDAYVASNLNNANTWLNPAFKYENQNAASHANSDNFRKRQMKRMKDAGWKK